MDSQARQAGGRPRSNEAARAMLHRLGLRPTRQRVTLARLLFDGRSRHVTAEQLHSEAAAAGGAMSLATIYNTLHLFCATGLLRQVVVPPARTYFDTNVSEHHHVYVEGQGALRDIPGDEIMVAGLPAAPEGYAVERVDIVVRWRADDERDHE